jgi:4a-hydroxytetrahydrobiopterin dehydratase
MTGARGKNENAAQRALAAMHCVPKAPKLSTKELADQLACLTGWKHIGDRIEKSFRFADYHKTIAFVNAVAKIANREDHHPDLSVYYDRCVVVWSTHTAGGVTLNDCICAANVEEIAAAA